MRDSTYHLTDRQLSGAFLDTGMTPTEALDFWATVLWGFSQAEWATVRNVDEDEITANVTSARGRLHSR